jgi:hypothetical protein
MTGTITSPRSPVLRYLPFFSLDETEEVVIQLAIVWSSAGLQKKQWIAKYS